MPLLDRFSTEQLPIIPYTQIQNVTADRILGRLTVSGSIQELTAAQVRTLINVSDGANAYTLPTATSTVLGGVELFSDTVQTTAANAVTTTASRTYGIQLNSSGQMVVNVPWVDTNTTYSAATSTTLGLVELFSDTVQTTAANVVTTTASRTYGIQVNSDGQMVVNVPWSDTDTVYTHPAYTARSIDTTGAQVIDVFTSDAIGSVTNITTRTMTLADLGYTGATNADNYGSWLIAASGTAGTGTVASGNTVTLSAGTGMTVTRSTNTVTFATTITQYTDALARAAISLTTTGNSGAATYSSATGVFNIPNYTLAGLGGLANPMTTLGDTIYGGASGIATRLAGNTTTTKQYLSQTGTGTVSVAPTWSTIAGSDVTGAALTSTNDTNVTVTLGGTSSTALLRATSITLGWTGQLAIARGGTGLSALGTANQLLRVNAGGTALEYFTHNFETAFSKGDLVQGTAVTLTGTLTGRLVGTGNITVAHADTSTQASVSNTDGTVLQSATLDTYGHTTALTSLNGDNRWARLVEVLNNSSTWSHVSLQNGIDFTGYTTGSSNYPSTLGFAVAFYASTSDSTSGYGRAFALNRAYNTEDYYIGSPNTSGTHNGWRLLYHSGNLSISTLSGVPTSRTITINGTALDLSANRSWSVGTVTSLNGLTAATQTFANDTNVTITSSTSTHTIGWSGQLAVSRGGTGASTLTGVLVGNGTSAVTAVAGTASQLLRRNAGNTAYEFFTPTYLTATPTLQEVTTAGNITTVPIGFRGTDSATLFQTENASASNASQFYLAHDFGNVRLGNLRGAISFFTNVTERVRITDGGLCINTTSAVAPLTILVANSGTDVQVAELTNNVNASFAVHLRTDITTISAGGTGNMVFANGVSRTERMRITSGGNVLIGTTTDIGTRLYVAGAGVLTGNLNIGQGSGAGETALNIGQGKTVASPAYIDFQTQSGGSVDFDFRILKESGVNGSVSLRNIAGSMQLINEASETLLFGTANTGRMYVLGNGNVLINTVTDAGYSLRVNGIGLFDSGLRTGAPTGSSAQTWKLGAANFTSSGTPTHQVIVEIAGTVYKLLAVV